MRRHRVQAASVPGSRRPRERVDHVLHQSPDAIRHLQTVADAPVAEEDWHAGPQAESQRRERAGWRVCTASGRVLGEGLRMDEDVVGRLFFGRDNAETDLVDGLLQTGFLETVAFGDAFASPKNLVIGRKGSGKSAIRVRLAVPGVREGPPPSSHLTMRLGVKSAGSNYRG